MRTWRRSKVMTYYGSADGMETDVCVVSLGDGRITVTYDYHDGERLVAEAYEGIEIGQGHFSLKSQDGLGKASLHSFPDAISWTDGGKK